MSGSNGDTPGGVAADQAAEGRRDKEAGCEELQALIVVFTVGRASMARVLCVVIHIWKELLQKGWHAGDSSSDTVVELHCIEVLFSEH